MTAYSPLFPAFDDGDWRSRMPWFQSYAQPYRCKLRGAANQEINFELYPPGQGGGGREYITLLRYESGTDAIPCQESCYAAQWAAELLYALATWGELFAALGRRELEVMAEARFWARLRCPLVMEHEQVMVERDFAAERYGRVPSDGDDPLSQGTVRVLGEACWCPVGDGLVDCAGVADGTIWYAYPICDACHRFVVEGIRR